MLKISLIVITILFNSSLLIANSYAASSANSIIAVVGESVITTQDLLNRIYLLKILNNYDDVVFTAGFNRKILDSIIEEKIILSEGDKYDLTISPDEFKFHYDRLSQQIGSEKSGLLLTFLNNNSYRDYDNSIRNFVIKSSGKADYVDPNTSNSLINQIIARALWVKLVNYKLRPQIIPSGLEIDEASRLEYSVDENLVLSQLKVETHMESDRAELDQYENKIGTFVNYVDSCDKFEKFSEEYLNLKTERVEVSSNEIDSNLYNMIKYLPDGKPSNIIRNENSLLVVVICSRENHSSYNKKEVEENLIEKKLSLKSEQYLDNLKKKTHIEYFADPLINQ